MTTTTAPPLRSTGGPRRFARRLALGLLAAGAALSAGAPAGAATVVETDHIRTEIVLRSSVVAPGDTVDVAIRQKIADGWHTYWTNPGDSGEALRLSWTLPEGAAAGPIRFPAPQRIPYPPLMNFGYKGEVTMLTSLTVPADWPAGRPLPVTLDLDWLVCEAICIPESAAAAFSVPTGVASEPDSLSAFTFIKAERALPQGADLDGAATLGDATLSLTVDAPAGGVAEAYFFPLVPGVIDHAAEQDVASAGGRLTIAMIPARDAPDGALEGVLEVTDADGRTRHIAVAAPLSDERTGDRLAAAAPGGASGLPGGLAGTTATGAGAGASPGLFQAVLFAFLGGIILNLMPCVFPVLALKALGLVERAGEPFAGRATEGLAYTGGILVCFMALAAALSAVKAAGAEVGWGFQLQDPLVVAVLAYVIFAVGLNLSGLFEVGAGLTRAGAIGQGKSGGTGAFLTGLLAAVVATPCTAPFMALAVGYALTAGTATTLAVFLALGVGLALPFLVLSLSPGLARLLPRPGAWMVRLRQLLAFPMYLAAAWLVWVLAQQSGADAILFTLAGFVGLGFGGWLLGLVQHGAMRGRRLGLAGAAVAAVAAVALLVPLAAGSVAGPATAAAPPAGTIPYSAARLADLRAEGTPVFLNVTAAWCISCKVNERVALSSTAFREALADNGVAYMTGDWTRRDPEITRLLSGFGRAGVPLYVVYPADGGAPRVLPQILTEGMVVNALRQT